MQTETASALSKMEQAQVIEHIKEVAGKTLPKGTSLWLYGSRARGDARPNSDYDLLILIDKDRLTLDDYRVALPLNYLSWDIGVQISPQVYARKEWNDSSYTPFYENVERDKRILI